MKVTKTALSGVLLLEPARFGDARGFFAESWNRKTLLEHGIDIVWGLAARTVADRWRAFNSISLQQSKHLPLRDSQHVRAVLNTQPSIIDLRQHLYAVQLALAHHHPSHAQSPVLT